MRPKALLEDVFPGYNKLILQGVNVVITKSIKEQPYRETDKMGQGINSLI